MKHTRRRFLALVTGAIALASAPFIAKKPRTQGYFSLTFGAHVLHCRDCDKIETVVRQFNEHGDLLSEERTVTLRQAFV